MSAGKTEHKSHFKEYIIIFFILAFLTVLELFIPGLDTTQAMKAIGLTLLAVAKAFIVAYYYMHLNHETRWTKFLAAIPISAALFAIVLILEGMYR